MANYTTSLKNWGAAGSEFPSGYNYLEGEQPVDEWDNWLTDQLIGDIKDHLIPLTNSRIESDTGGSGNEPSSPELSHLYHDTSAERLEVWDDDKSTWYTHLRRDGDTMAGTLDMDGHNIEDSQGVLTLDSSVRVKTDLLVDSGLEVGSLAQFRNDIEALDGITPYTLWDSANNEVPTTPLKADTDDDGLIEDIDEAILTEGGARELDAADFAGDNGSADDLLISDGTSVSWGRPALGDLSNVTASGEGHGNGFNADTVDGSHRTDLEDNALIHNDGFAPNFGG